MTVLLALVACLPASVVPLPGSPAVPDSPEVLPGAVSPIVPTRPSAPEVTEPAAGPGPGNVLLVVLDDVGVDKLAMYGEHPDQPATPTLDGLAADGVRFQWAYSAPTCSPTRAELLTGRQGRRYDLGVWIHAGEDDYTLPATEMTIPRMLDAAPDEWTSGMVGKWHLVSYDRPQPERHPFEMGFDDYTGSLANLPDYFRWDKVVDGRTTESTTYATTDTVDEAVDRLERYPEPFFLTVTLNAAHTPLHVPPEGLYSTPITDPASQPQLYGAMVEAADAELGRLLAGIDPEVRARTTVVVIADNGTDADMIVPPFDAERHKGDLYDGGVRVPMIVTGPQVAVPGSVSDALVSVVDVFPTVAELAGVDPATFANPIDGRSFLPQLRDPGAPGRDVLYSDQFSPNGAGRARDLDERMVRDAAYKLVVDARGEHLFHYTGGIDEGDDLLAHPRRAPLDADAAAALDRLRVALSDASASFAR